MPRIVNSLSSLQHFLSKILQSCSFELERTTFSQQQEWLIKDGILSHKTGGFFHIIGLNHANSDLDNIFLFQPQSALTGIIFHHDGTEIYLLTQARIEPGNTGVVQLGPTVQSTPANFLRLHNGKKTPYLDIIYSGHKDVIGFNSTNHLDLGKLYYQKTKWLNYAEVDHFLDTQDSFIWVPLSVLLEGAKVDYLLNTDLRSLLVVFDWDSLENKSISQQQTNSNILHYYLNQVQPINSNCRFIKLDNSENIVVTNDGVRVLDSNQKIGLYNIQTKYREVNQWTQPLWKAKNKGSVVLLCRNFSEQPEFLLTVKEEPGVANGLSISPSYLCYPDDEPDPHFSKMGSSLIKFWQSDEGGRFINHEYLFQVIEEKQEMPIKDNQFWVNVMELKKLLSTPNLCNIQLRNICSVIIDKLNPNTLGHKTTS